MNYFITGGAGFIGREIVRQLLQFGHKVCIYDDFSFGSVKNINEFHKNILFRIIKGKIENHSHLVRSMKRDEPEVVIHLAALHFIPYCNSHPLSAIKTNVEGTYSVFEASVKSNVKRVLFASSGALYASVDHPLIEDQDKPNPTDVYGCSKLLGEQICEYYSRMNQLEVVAMRFFNTYGPYETNKHLIPEIMKQLHKHSFLRLGNVETKRDYIYTEDIARGVIKLSQCKKNQRFEIVNIGTGKEYSVAELVKKISKIMGKELDVKIETDRLRKSDKLHQIADLQHIKNIADWEPSIEMDEGLHKLLHYEKLV
jgi:UDP-glucose 4-epimerase